MLLLGHEWRINDSEFSFHFVLFCNYNLLLGSWLEHRITVVACFAVESHSSPWNLLPFLALLRALRLCLLDPRLLLMLLLSNLGAENPIASPHWWSNRSRGLLASLFTDNYCVIISWDFFSTMI
jgi:hypothetical protein